MTVTEQQLPPELSVVVPAFNEAQGILAFLEQLHGILVQCCASFEVIVVDDGSHDNTWELLSAAAGKGCWLHALRFTRNFGKEAAILAGLRHSCGRGVVVMDADGQHPPQLLPRLLAPWRAGEAQIVAARKQQGAVTLISRFNTFFFNALMRQFTGLDMENASDYRLMDRSVVNTLLAFPERCVFQGDDGLDRVQDLPG